MNRIMLSRPEAQHWDQEGHSAQTEEGGEKKNKIEREESIQQN